MVPSYTNYEVEKPNTNDPSKVTVLNMVVLLYLLHQKKSNSQRTALKCIFRTNTHYVLVSLAHDNQEIKAIKTSVNLCSHSAMIDFIHGTSKRDPRKINSRRGQQKNSFTLEHILNNVQVVWDQGQIKSLCGLGIELKGYNTLCSDENFTTSFGMRGIAFDQPQH